MLFFKAGNGNGGGDVDAGSGEAKKNKGGGDGEGGGVVAVTDAPVHGLVGRTRQTITWSNGGLWVGESPCIIHRIISVRKFHDRYATANIYSIIYRITIASL
jgi:hypothetical protein